MKTRKFSVVIILIGCIVMAIAAACSTGATKQGKAMAERGQNVFTIETAPGLSAAQVEDVILKALANRGWTVTSKSPGKIDADLDEAEKREIHGILAIDYTDKLITIHDKSVDDKGVPFVPIRWITHLTRDINSGMGINSK